MIAPLLLAAALGAQAPSAGPSPLERFVVCPGNARCPARPSLQELGGGGLPHQMTNPGPGHMVNYAGPESGGSPGNSLLFDPGDATLSVEARERLDLSADEMRIADDLDVLLEGHADSHEPGAGAALAGRRAEAAADYLLARGVPADRILAVSWGAQRQPGLEQPRSVVVTLQARPRAR